MPLQPVVIFAQRPAMMAEAQELSRAITNHGKYRPVIVGASRTAVPTSGANTDGRSRSAITDGVRTLLSLIKTAMRFRSEVPADAAAVVFFDDRAPAANLIRIRLARKEGIATLLVPYAHSGPESDEPARRGRSEYAVGSSSLSRWLERIAPRHIRPTPDGALLFYEKGTTAALALTGFGQTSPWVVGGGDADVVGVLGEDDREVRITGGVPADRIVVIGQPSHDNIARAARLSRGELAERLPASLQGSAAPLIVVAMPQYAEHGQTSWDQQQTLVRTLLRAVSGHNARVMVSLHPRSNPADYAALAAEFGCVIGNRPLADILPAADIFVATYSSTTLWAIALGIPTVVSDLLNQNMPMFANTPAVPVTRTGDELSGAIRTLAASPEKRASLRAELMASAERFIRIDGHACDRVIAEIERLANQRRPHHAD